MFPESKVKSALQTVYENNVQRFGGGQMGAINGCKPDGSADRTTVQSEEFWTGVSYALSANFLQEVSGAVRVMCRGLVEDSTLLQYR